VRKKKIKGRDKGKEWGKGVSEKGDVGKGREEKRRWKSVG